jgi:hypothetical protein
MSQGSMDHLGLFSKLRKSSGEEACTCKGKRFCRAELKIAAADSTVCAALYILANACNMK